MEAKHLRRIVYFCKMIDSLAQEIDRATTEFMASMPDVEKKIYSKLLLELKNLSLYSDGSIKNNYENIRAINKIKKTLNEIILNKTYLTQVSGFIDAYTAVEKIQNSYFSKLTSEFSPMKVLEEVKRQAVNDVADMLTENGMNVNIVDPIKQIIKTNITSGGSYAELTEQLRDKILGTEELDGVMVKYAGQITTDSLAQFSATYTKLITDDLGLTWFRYTGSIIKTSRPFCIALVKKSYVHVNEFPELVRGIVDGKQTPLGKNGLPLGMNENTTVDNFPVLRGGYNCKHLFVPISTESVPKNLRDKFE